MNPIPRIRSFWSESDPVVSFEDPDQRIRSGVNDTSLLLSCCRRVIWVLHLLPKQLVGPSEITVTRHWILKFFNLNIMV
ncbi:hypothetical protein AVEN_22125-1 [Araneus ventricosus]|uniref:Uncharacterized protein n=1 Tax=Araneus ventricosus TaxID=182803 RepID=A0A4Y2TJG9_ARAVE|nr:hypothetical protein AVEN_22125-1 [Araneus ventricosus]